MSVTIPDQYPSEEPMNFATTQSDGTIPTRIFLPNLNFKTCAHCDTPFNEDTRATKAFIARFVRRGKELQEEVKITEALKKLYYWKFNDHYEFDKHIKFCDLCGLAFARLYGAMEIFDQLAVSHSYLSQLLEAHEVSLRLVLDGRMNEIEAVDAEFITPEIQDDIAINENDLSNEFMPDPVYQPGAADDEAAAYPTPLSPRAANLGLTEKEPEVFDKAYLCDICAKGFESNRSLQTHLLLTHEIGSKEKEYVCHCGKAFFYPYLLANHQRVHSEERPIACDLCEAKFKTKCGLNHHVIHVHAAADRPYKCEVCGKSYKEDRSLREHFNINHKPATKVSFFKCKYSCGAKTPRRRSLFLHYKKCKKRPLQQGDPLAVNYNDTPQNPNPGVLIRAKKDGTVELIDLSENPNSSSAQTLSLTPASTKYTCPADCGRSFKSKAYLRKHIAQYCLKRKDAPVRLRLHQRNYNEHKSRAETSTIPSEAGEDPETDSLKLVPVEVVSILPIEIMESTGENSCEEIMPSERHERGRQGPIPMYLDSVEVDEEFIETETITFHEVMGMDDNFSTL